MQRDNETDLMLGGRLDDDYRAYIAARAQAIQALGKLMNNAFKLAATVTEARNDLRMSFVRWCSKYCRVFDPRVVRAVCGVAHRTHVEGRTIETWQLRLLGIVNPVHHSERPQARKRKHKPTSWLSFISKSNEEIHKLIERAGGIQNIPQSERSAIVRQIGSLDGVRAKLTMRHE